MQFSDLRLADPILRAISYPTPTPIQAKSIPHVMEGRDVLGCAQTGTGKTAAFALPILHTLSTTPRPEGKLRPRVLILCPTRELANQTADCFSEYGRNLNLRTVTIFGGVAEKGQIRALRAGVDVIIATPGRLLDLVRQSHADLRAVQTLVLDEADRMLDMGFIHDIRKLVAQLPARRQTLMFSATMPREIRTLADSLLKNPAVVEVAPVSSTVDAIDQSVYFVTRSNKPQLLATLVKDLPMFRAIVFTRTKHGADRVVKQLDRFGIRSQAIHGNKSQNARERALEDFKRNKTHVLVATDIASRGIDVDGITHVVNYDLTHEPETYVHRIGRTARAGATGSAIAFCDHEEVPNLRAIERLIRKPIPQKSHPHASNFTPSSLPTPTRTPTLNPNRPHQDRRHPNSTPSFRNPQSAIGNSQRPRHPHQNHSHHSPKPRPHTPTHPQRAAAASTPNRQSQIGNRKSPNPHPLHNKHQNRRPGAGPKRFNAPHRASR